MAKKKLIFVLAIILAIILSVWVGTVVIKKKNKSSSSTPSRTTSAAVLKAVCKQTHYPDSCYSSISALNVKNATDPQELFRISLRVVIDSIKSVSNTLSKKSTPESGLFANQALKVCQYVLDDALDRLDDSLSSMDVKGGDAKNRKLSPRRSKIDDLKNWLTTTITDQDTCLDALAEFNATALVGDSMTKPTEYASNSLSIVTHTLGVLAKFNILLNRRLLGVVGHRHGFPQWVSSSDRRLLQETNPKPNVTVASDGTGNYTTIGEALRIIPNESDTRFVIYVKAGKYVENNLVDKHKRNVMIYGDGKDKTIVSSNLNYIDGTRTIETATFAADGIGFMAKDMTFKNTAGPEKHQAVAFRSSSDYSVFYRCNFEAFQDTLYAHRNYQFYRECDITGTIDFIFGHAAAVFQNCNIKPRQPMKNQYVTITAQGKTDSDQHSAFSIQKCNISAFDKIDVPVYLGRPWKDYSTTVIMQSNIGAFVHPLGWIEWVIKVEPPSTIFYAEYKNTGPGAALDGRVKWPGYKVPFTAEQASMFSVEKFINGSKWLPARKVVYEPNL